MRSFRWAAMGAVLGAAVAGLGVLGGAPDAYAQGYGYYDGSGYRSRPHLRPAPRAHRYYYYSGPVGYQTCGQFKYWSHEKGRCLDARTSPPDLSKPAGYYRR
jgi:hypothetical protein